MCQELAGQLQRDLLPKLEPAGVRLVAVGIGKPETAAEFCEHTSLSPQVLFADPTNAVGTALDLPYGEARTFGFTDDLSSYKAVWERLRRDGARDLVSAALRWKIWLPPTPPKESGLGRFAYGMQQGGVLVFAGDELVFEHRDPSTAAHANLEQVAEAALR